MYSISSISRYQAKRLDVIIGWQEAHSSAVGELFGKLRKNSPDHYKYQRCSGNKRAQARPTVSAARLCGHEATRLHCMVRGQITPNREGKSSGVWVDKV